MSEKRDSGRPGAAVGKVSKTCGRLVAYTVREAAGPADWNRWRQIPKAELWRVVALSLGVEPGDWDDVFPHGLQRDDAEAVFPEGYWPRLSHARALLDDGIPSADARSESPDAEVRRAVRFDDFRMWAAGIEPPMPLPAEFPGAHLSSPHNSKRGAVVVAMGEAKRFAFRLELPFGKPVRIGDLPGLWAGAIHESELARAATEESIWRTLNADVLNGTLEPLSPLTLTRHEFPHGDALRRAVILPESLRPMLARGGIELVLIEPGNGPDLWSIENASRDLGEIEGWNKRQIETLCEQMLDAARSGALIVRHPHTELPVSEHKRATVRDFYELVRRDDVNAWLSNINAPYRWFTYEQAAAQPRYIAGRKLWKLTEAINAVAAMAGFDVTAAALTERVQRAAEKGEIMLRDLAHGGEVRSDWFAVALGSYLYAEDFNSWLEAAGYPEPYRLRDTEASDSVGQSAGAAAAEKGTRRVWTPERLEELKAYRKRHGTKKAAEWAGVSQSRVRELLPGDPPPPKGYSAFNPTRR